MSPPPGAAPPGAAPPGAADPGAADPGAAVGPYAADLAFALRLADLAAVVTLAGFGGRHDVTMKTDDTPVTAIDAAAEHEIRAAVAAHLPDDGVLGEEGGPTPGANGEEGGPAPGANGRVWVIDPIDGTKLFAEGIPLWTTLIGLRVDGEMVAAVADAPALGERFHAVRGGGAWWGSERVSVSEVSRLEQSFLLHAGVEEFGPEGLPGLSRLASHARGTRGIADGWAHLLVARGAAEGLIEMGRCHEWDWAATSLIVEEAGGRVTALEGGPPYSDCQLLVTNGLVDDQVRATLGVGR